ncbi:MAG: glycosyltransferase family 4 protein [Candidatus Pseudobacter hemicellulosilyticus]|uniref:Glycosyltransferase family 4 protein n=1 Tax=Candidatus Pseudobacter hemicellulosilyticus TaxID=3121375 RepID=A0AAJ5WQX5_9BACT|nr:MAG: glycosyltransferase family 4 protein [Pseudobacter sp.]
MKSLLFFTPYAGRTGSEMFLWYMFSRFDRTLIKANLISECQGELLHQMPEDIGTFVTLKYPGRMARIAHSFSRAMGVNKYEDHLMKLHRSVKPDYWYLNTVQMTDKTALARKQGIPVIAHFHELTTDYSLVSYQQLKDTIDYATLCIADSKAVYERLQVLGAKNIALQYECIDCSKINPDPSRSAAIKKELGLGSFDFIWLMSGTSIHRKGVDMVPQLAGLLKEQNAAVVWLGNNTRSGMDLMIEKELAHKGLDNVRFLGKKVEDYYHYMNVMDGFVLTSREEPFGMVVVEALLLGKPVVSFNAGGVAEIVTPGTGSIVNSWNISDLAAAMKDIATGKTPFDAATATARAKDFDVSVQVNNWHKILTAL